MRNVLPTLLIALVCTSCSPTPSSPPIISRSIRNSNQIQTSRGHTKNHYQRAQVVAKAQQLLANQKELLSRNLLFESNPVGFVQACYWNAKIDVFDRELAKDSAIKGLTLLAKSAKKKKQFIQSRPQPGDMVFFQSSSPSKSTAPLPQQVAIVEKIDSQGTINAIGYFSEGPLRIRFNLTQKHRQYASNGKLMNDRLSSVANHRGEPAGTLILGFSNPFFSPPQTPLTNSYKFPNQTNRKERGLQ